MKNWLAILFFANTVQLFAQTDSAWVIHLKNQKPYKPYNQFDFNDFYLYIGSAYDFELLNDSTHEHRLSSYPVAKLIDVKKDTIYITSYFNESVAKKNNKKLDTLAVNVSYLKNIHVLGDRIMGAGTRISLSDYRIETIRVPEKENSRPALVPLYYDDTLQYEITPYLTFQGYDYLYERGGQTYYYQGRTFKPGTQKIDSNYRVRNIGWFTPNRVEKINGLAIGFWPENTKNGGFDGGDSLTINGLNIEIMPMTGFIWLIGETGGDGYIDTTDYAQRLIERNNKKSGIKIQGVSIGASGIMLGNASISGLNIAGLCTSAKEIHGLSISGILSSSYQMNGLSVGGLINSVAKGNGIQIGAINRAVDLKGVQIGLYNRAKKLKGLQIGLWNNNGRFSLPLINFRW